MLARERDRARDRDGQRHAASDRLVGELPDTTQVGATERGQALLEDPRQVLDLGDAPGDELLAGAVGGAAGALVLAGGGHGTPRIRTVRRPPNPGRRFVQLSSPCFPVLPVVFFFRPGP